MEEINKKKLSKYCGISVHMRKTKDAVVTGARVIVMLLLRQCFSARYYLKKSLSHRPH